jgi:hypothetical protein
LVQRATKTAQQREEIFASKRAELDIDMTRLDGEYKHRYRSKRAVSNAPISWIYLHGTQLEKRKGNKWSKH